jgi:hypothetical protein
MQVAQTNPARVVLGRLLAERRHNAGLTQEQLARTVHTSRSNLAGVETGRQGSARDFWQRVDQATRSAGNLVAAYDRCRAAELDVASDVMVSLAGSGDSVLDAIGQLAGRAGTGAATARVDHRVRVDERACDFYVRGAGLMGGNDRRGVEAADALLDRAVDRDPRFARALAARGYTRCLSRRCSPALGLDVFESADVYDRVSALRPVTEAADPGRVDGLSAQLRPLLALPASAVDAVLADSAMPAEISAWLAAFVEAGSRLGEAASGELDRGLRAVLAHVVIFHWNRVGLSAATQAVLARAAAAVLC